MEGFNSAHDFFERITGIFNGGKNENNQYLDKICQSLQGIDSSLKNPHFERLSDNIIYTPLFESVRDITQTQQKIIENLRDVRASLEPVQQALGGEIISSAMIETPNKMQNALSRSPWEVLTDIRPAHLAPQPNNPDLVPIFFKYQGIYYIGWQLRGALIPAFDCEFSKIWTPRSDDSPIISDSYQNEQPTLIVATRGMQGDFRSINAAIQAAKAGSRILVKAGIYQETIIINKPVQIVGSGQVTDIIIESWNGNCIRMQTDHALVKGLTLRCRASENSVAVYIPRGQLTVEQCDIASDSLACVEICNAEGIIMDCKIHDGKQNGVIVYQNGTGRIENCDIFANAYSGIEIKEGGNPIVRNCKIHDGKGSGVFVNQNGTGRIEDCDIFANAYSGIAIKEGGNPIVRNSLIKQNREAVRVYKNGAGSVENCDLRDNKMGAWRIESGCEVRRSGNRE